MKTRKTLLSIALVLVIVMLIGAWKFFGPAASQPESKFLFVKTGTDYETLKKQLVEEKILNGTMWFGWTSKLIGFSQVKPGKYAINKGMSLVNLVRMLRNGKQTPVDLVITKVRTKEALAARVGKLFECDSTEMLAFLNNPDSLSVFGLDSNTAMSVVRPLTYSMKWNSGAGAIFRQFEQASKIFWNQERNEEAAALSLTPLQVITLASIVDEETNAAVDKPKIASVYINRINQGMPLQADPTVKFALKNFAIRRVLKVHTEVVSPFNTYVHTGFPPGPINTPLASTIDSVLHAPKTDYLYFVASAARDGSHVFTSNYQDHMKYARLFHQELDKANIK